jgi:uncharacterized protein (DUF305 family)
MENKNIVYGIIGLLVGIVGSFCFITYYRDNDDYGNKGNMMHVMPNGSMMSNEMDGMMAGLQGKTGDAFDKEFLSEMIVHHQGAVEMAKAVLATSKRPELIKLANNIISAQNKEIGMMQNWQKMWFK